MGRFSFLLFDRARPFYPQTAIRNWQKLIFSCNYEAILVKLTKVCPQNF